MKRTIVWLFGQRFFMKLIMPRIIKLKRENCANRQTADDAIAVAVASVAEPIEKEGKIIKWNRQRKKNKK